MPSARVARHQPADVAVAEHAQRPGTHASSQQRLPASCAQCRVLGDDAAHRGEDQRDREFGRRVRGARPRGDRDPALGAGGDVDVRARARGLTDDAQAGQQCNQFARDAGALANQHQRLDATEPRRQRSRVGDGLVDHDHVVVAQAFEARQRPHAVLIIVEDRDSHGSSLF
jgi:hypothetical protein